MLSSLQATNSDKLDMTNLDEVKLEKMILSQVNLLRKKKRLKTLRLDSILSYAASDQADYLLKKNRLTHNQPNKKKKTPIDRTDFYGGNFEYVGENVAYTYYNKSVNSAQFKNKVEIITTYAQLANHFYWLWKNSKPHYKNIVDREFELTSIRFSYDKKRQKIYAAQVFGAK